MLRMREEGYRDEPVLLRPAPRGEFPLAWKAGQFLKQGYIGAAYLNDFTVSSGGQDVELDDDEYEVLPAFGGGGQWKLAGQRLDFGVEGYLAFSTRSDLEAFASSGGAAVAAFDINLLVLEAYGGPFVSRFVGDRLRLYAGGGPLLSWVGYDADDDDDTTDDEDTDGAGGGVYFRGGLEFLLPTGKLVGFGARWSESSVDLGGTAGDLDLDRVEVYFTYSYGLGPRSAFDP